MIDRGDTIFSERVEGGGGGHWSHLHITNWIPFHVLHDDMLLYWSVAYFCPYRDHIEHIEILIFTKASKLHKVIPI